MILLGFLLMLPLGNYAFSKLVPWWRATGLDSTVYVMYTVAMVNVLLAYAGGVALGNMLGDGAPVILPYADYRPALVDNGFHGDGEWPGRDWEAPCGTTLVAPISGTVVRVGRDGYSGPYGSYNTYVHLTNGRVDVVLMHGHYLVRADQYVVQGEEIGAEASEGNSTHCHTHMAVKIDGQLVDPVYLDTLTYLPHGRIPPQDLDQLPALVTYYNPELGGINCDGDCSVMASGRQVDFDVPSVACPAEIPMYTRITIRGMGTFACLDRGGMIKVTYSEVYKREVVHFDVLSREPIRGGLYDWEYADD